MWKLNTDTRAEKTHKDNLIFKISRMYSEVICIHKEKEKELPVGESFYIFLRKMDLLCT